MALTPRLRISAALLPLLLLGITLGGWLAAMSPRAPQTPDQPFSSDASAVYEPDRAVALPGPTARPRIRRPVPPAPAGLVAAPTASPTIVPPPPTPTIVPLPGQGPIMPGTLVAQGPRVDLYLGRDTFQSWQVRELTAAIEAALSESEALLGTTLRARTSLGFYRPGASPTRGIRGLAFSDERRLQLFYGAWEEHWRSVAIAAHELAHQLEADRYGDEAQQRADTILHEGLATWLSGQRWLEQRGATSWRERGRQLQQRGQLRSLLDDPSGAAANDAYDGWASFVDYLITTYGWPAFDDLYRSGRGRFPGSADYQLVYGRGLDQLAEEWRAWLAP